MSEKINSVYSDYLNTTFNLYNFTLHFGMVEEREVKNFGRIKISPESAKQLAQLLQTNIESYEKIYGKINEYTPEIAEKEKEFIEKVQKKEE